MINITYSLSHSLSPSLTLTYILSFTLSRSLSLLTLTLLSHSCSISLSPRFVPFLVVNLRPNISLNWLICQPLTCDLGFFHFKIVINLWWRYIPFLRSNVSAPIFFSFLNNFFSFWYSRFHQVVHIRRNPCFKSLWCYNPHFLNNCYLDSILLHKIPALRSYVYGSLYGIMSMSTPIRLF